MIAPPNPQGKGLVPLLDCLAQARAVTVPPKGLEQISHELFTSLFVLQSRFAFKPVPGKIYYLYQRANGFALSLIGPQEWGGGGFGLCVGQCMLQNDVTWTLELDPQARENETLMRYIETTRKQFEQALFEAQTLEAALPVHVKTLSFYQRLLAWALAGSLRSSMHQSGLRNLSYAEARKALVDSRQVKPNPHE
ncbi:MAG: DUF2452 domain-containing protein [Gammaproteobacteria bacterium]|nr:DUF2452 domain-containing protein [Gammaproteobacteria bacterium]MDH5803477.1 DUF2452 domain-containing protein [Gammaproteobacteria bacterium]